VILAKAPPVPTATDAQRLAVRFLKVGIALLRPRRGRRPLTLREAAALDYLRDALKLLNDEARA
jgi:hypothetical protein